MTTASAGDTIIVRDGTYTENVNVNKKLTIKAENPTYATTVTASNSDDHVFEVIAGTDYVNISWFKVKDATGARQAGIYLAPNTDHCNISYNNATNNYVGIRLNKSSNNNISFNNASANEGGSGIGVGKRSNYNTVDNNTVTHNQKNGIGVGVRSNYTTIRDNNASYNEQHGIYVNFSSNYTTIRDNTAISNNSDYGICVNRSSNYTTIRNNTAISNNSDYGVKIRNSYNCNIYYNNFYNNKGSDPDGENQAWDNKGKTVNNWDDGTGVANTGNYWDAWDWDPPYSIDGNAGQEDEKPSQTPFSV